MQVCGAQDVGGGFDISLAVIAPCFDIRPTVGFQAFRTFGGYAVEEIAQTFVTLRRGLVRYCGRPVRIVSGNFDIHPNIHFFLSGRQHKDNRCGHPF